MAKKDKAAKGARADEVETRLARIEAALAALGTAAPGPVVPEGPDGRLRMALRGGPAGDWRHEVPVAALMAADWAAAAARLAVLGHPARLAILRAALGGPVTAAALMAAAGTTTPGQFYHHLRELTAAGWLKAERRGSYGVPPERAGAVLAAVAAGMAGWNGGRVG